MDFRRRLIRDYNSPYRWRSNYLADVVADDYADADVDALPPSLYLLVSIIVIIYYCYCRVLSRLLNCNSNTMGKAQFYSVAVEENSVCNDQCTVAPMRTFIAAYVRRLLLLLLLMVMMMVMVFVLLMMAIRLIMDCIVHLLCIIGSLMCRLLMVHHIAIV